MENQRNKDVTREDHDEIDDRYNDNHPPFAEIYVIPNIHWMVNNPVRILETSLAISCSEMSSFP